MDTPKPLSQAFNVCVLHIASKLYPSGFDTAEDTPEDWHVLQAHVRKTGRMVVSNLYCNKTIFASPSVNHAFRAWHDHAHLRSPENQFTPLGEYLTMLEMYRDVAKIYGPPHASKATQSFQQLIHAEIIGQLEYNLAHDGAFPTDQRAFVVGYLINPTMAVAKKY